MFKELASLINSRQIGNISRQDRDRYFEAVGDAPEIRIQEEVGRVMKDKIMAWFYYVCDAREKERKLAAR
jgi:hypothetical protein